MTFTPTPTPGIVQCPSGNWQLVFDRQVWNLPVGNTRRMTLSEALENELNLFKAYSNSNYGYGADPATFEASDITEANRLHYGPNNWEKREITETHIRWDFNSGQSYNRAGEWLWNGVGDLKGNGKVGINLTLERTFYFNPINPNYGHSGYAKNHKISIVEILPAPPCPSTPSPSPIPSPLITPTSIYLGIAAPPPLPPKKKMNCCDCNTIATIIADQMANQVGLFESIKDHIDSRTKEEIQIFREQLEALEIDLQPILDRLNEVERNLWNGIPK